MRTLPSLFLTCILSLHLPAAEIIGQVNDDDSGYNYDSEFLVRKDIGSLNWTTEATAPIHTFTLFAYEDEDGMIPTPPTVTETHSDSIAVVHLIDQRSHKDNPLTATPTKQDLPDLRNPHHVLQFLTELEQGKKPNITFANITNPAEAPFDPVVIDFGNSDRDGDGQSDTLGDFATTGETHEPAPGFLERTVPDAATLPADFYQLRVSPR